jgi:Xaa-Pro aminopeptidase
MVLHLVPHTIVPGVGTVGLSETVLVRQQGAEVLTDFPRRVLVL